MAFVAPGLIQGLAAGFGGDQLLTELALNKLKLRAGQQQEQQAEEATSANKVWSKAIMDVLAGAQTPLPPIQAPAPGQASVPMTQGSAGVPVTPGAPPGGGQPPTMGAPQPPSPTAALLQGQPMPQSSATPSAPPTPTFQQLDVSNILQKIKADNPGIEPGVLASVVNDHILPLMDAQSQQNYKNFQQQLELAKLDNTQQDKMLQLYFKYDQLQQTMQDRQLSRDERLQIADMSNAIRQEMVSVMSDYHSAQADHLRAQTANLTAADKLPPIEKQQYDMLKTKLNTITRKFTSAQAAGADQSVLDIYDQQMQDTEKSMQDLIDKAGAKDGGTPAPDAGGDTAGSIPLSADQKSDPDGTKYQGSDGKTYVKKGDVAVPQ